MPNGEKPASHTHHKVAVGGLEGKKVGSTAAANDSQHTDMLSERMGDG